MLNFFALTLFVSATLLLWIQPLFTKMVLPLLGGSPAVWNPAMMFFQAVLLLGYAYAHLSAKVLADAQPAKRGSGSPFTPASRANRCPAGGASGALAVPRARAVVM